MSSKEKIIKKLPYFSQNLLVTLFNTYQYYIRHSGVYQEKRNYYNLVDKMNDFELNNEINKKTQDFLNHVCNTSKWYAKFLPTELSSFPILEKKDLIDHLDVIKTLNEKDGLVSLTGGTTGASMKVIYTKSDMQERFAILDHFRAQYGYKLGRKTAWFSGKNIIIESDLQKGICSHYDFINKIRFYSTFLINEKSFDIYWKSLNEFEPEFLVGFPSSVFEICQIAKSRNLKYKGKAKVFFPTAETVLPEHRKVIQEVLGCKLVNQYASSEGAPFILECEKGNMHLHLLTGIFEVVDEDINPSNQGQLLVTSFTTHGTPLVRYRIGDSIDLDNENRKCSCGSLFPLVNSIDGRTTDYILSVEYGKINLGNISNSTKDVKGVNCFQLIQNNLDSIELKMVVNKFYNKLEEDNFIESLRERLGDKIIINIEYVDNIPKEKSGKFRIVKNNLLSK